MNRCATGAGDAFVSSLVRYIDCQAKVFELGSWGALATPGSSLTLLLTSLLTILIALIGYDLLLGGRLSVRAATLTMVKIGLVLALATSWPAYRTLVYNVVVDGPVHLT